MLAQFLHFQRASVTVLPDGLICLGLLRRRPEGRNPKTGETLHIPAKRMPHFRIGKELYDRINPTVHE
jgi:hypothetical protein